jgi:hypothetical protein
MSGIFPAAADGGLAPNANDQLNPTHAYPPVTAPVGTAALYYGNGCDVRLRPEVVNSLISEQEALIDRAMLPYNPNRLTNLELAARYLIQRGLPRGTVFVGGPNNFTATLDPPSTAYNNFMTLSILPEKTNTGPVTVNLDGHGPVPVVRNDGLNLAPQDLYALKPFEAIFYGGSFYVVGPVPSQFGGDAFDLTVLIFNASTSWPVPTGVTNIGIEAWGAGGGGAAGTGSGGGGGGGGGQYGLLYLRVVTGQILNLIVGVGGQGNQAGGNRGFPGGTTSISIQSGPVLMSCVGGGGGNLDGEVGSTPGQGGTGGMEMIDGSGGFPHQVFWGLGGSPGGGTARGRLYAMQGNAGLPPGGGGSGNQSDNYYYGYQLAGANGRVKITHVRQD